MEKHIEKVGSASRTSLQSGSDIDTLSEEELEALFESFDEAVECLD